MMVPENSGSERALVGRRERERERKRRTVPEADGELLPRDGVGRLGGGAEDRTGC